MLPTIAFHTDDVPQEQRLDAWREHSGRAAAPMDVVSVHAADFWGEQSLVRLGDVSLWPVHVQATRYRRTPRLIRQSDPGLYHVTVMLPGSGRLGVSQLGRETVHGPDDLYLIDMSRPLEVSSLKEDELLRGVGIEIPRELLRLPGRQDVDELLGRRLSGRSGFGALLVQYVTRVVEDRDVYEPSDVPRLNTVLLDLLTGLLASELQAEASLAPETQRRSTVTRVRSHIQRNLRDPLLSPQTIAAAHHLSTRQLHRLFADEELTVAAYIREQRLERARRELACGALDATPLHVIAARWGFPAMAHFSRAFRYAYGMPPSEYRQLARLVDGADAAPPVADAQPSVTDRQRHSVADAAGCR
ncbi:helix-turn-helix domain-containing protein [Streptomyces apocyni]|uniref:helix-turn-helix domain-containing protein n=1 Tax=Streptomyces apocyni TaxID=2654677 RepID=UPI0012EA41EC|nr:helix-turn-helix domain-containing protein [Streptomyces apocyni]